MRKLVVFVLVAMITMYAGAAHAAAVANSNYCLNPIFSSTAVKPNIMVIADFSGSMQFPAYVPCTWGGYMTNAAQCGTSTSATAGVPSYNSAHTYYAYFDSTKNYTYNASGYWQVNTTCTPSTSGGCWPGNLLNFVTATRVDVMRKMLTGGRTKTISSQLTFDNEGAEYTYTEHTLHCKFTLADTDNSDPTTRQIAISSESGFTCAYGTQSAANINIAIPATPTGILDQFGGPSPNDLVTFEAMIFNSSSGNAGLIKQGKQLNTTTDLTALKTAFNSQMAYNGTPTGEALWEAYDFFSQSDGHSGPSGNNGFMDKGNTSNDRDPWYDGTGSSKRAVPCRKSYVLLVSDGAWNGSVDPVIPARAMHVNDLRSDLAGVQNVTVYTVYAFGDLDPGTKIQGKNAMIMTALFGGHDFQNTGDWPYPFVSFNASSSNCSTVLTPAEDVTQKTNIKDVNSNTFCNSRYTPSGTAYSYLSQCTPPCPNPPCTNWNINCAGWDKHDSGPDGLPYNYFEADDPADLAARLTDALNEMLRRASSGTAASVLSSAQGSGANLLQAVYYPKRVFGNVEVAWTGEVQNLWYYIDPYLTTSSIREDSNQNKILDLNQDRILQYYFDTTENKTRVKLFTDSNGDGVADNSTPDTVVDLADLKNLWEAGQILQKTSPSSRRIYTSLDGSTLINFQTASPTTMQSYLQAASTTEASNIIQYVSGTDVSGYRNRTVSVTDNSGTTTTGVWKLGDVVTSTPRLQSSVPTQTYNLGSPDGYSDLTYQAYITSSTYTGRGMVYLGSNDGMLHAFELGKLSEHWSGQGTYQKAKLDPVSLGLGQESWAFIPKNALPYLTYLTSTSYCHTFSVDNPVIVADASISGGYSAIKTGATNWRTVLVGSMGIGGACRNKATPTACPAGTSNCVETPVTNVGLSSFFAFDVTNPSSPTLLWEFSDNTLGYTTSTPVIVRVGDATKNGKWFVIIASGPTGPIETTQNQFLGRSDQNLKLFILDLATGALLRTIDTGIGNAFGGSLGNASIDIERGLTTGSGRYSDDVVYVGYTQKDTVAGTWTQGGVLRLMIKNDDNPANWTVNTLISGIGPVTRSITKLQDLTKKELWIYFGTGRLFFKYNDGLTIDDPDTVQSIYGIKDPCYDSASALPAFKSTCVAISKGDLATPPSTSSYGWYINLNSSQSVTQSDGTIVNYKAERLLVDPLAAFNGVVYYVTFAPSLDVCSLGGETYLYTTTYNSGAAPSGGTSKVMLQLSTGNIIQTDVGSNILRTDLGGGQAGGQPQIQILPKPIKRILHIRER
ncbi:MAG TPA: PilC/PilY family type IV pilus protein [Syntrophorhabdaceae bacterium]|nr:PilC/PilY family type IV pilus protein [Syntrophorhabdaceae bacterium]